MKRSENYNAEISKKLRNPDYAIEYIMALMEGPEGLSPEDALRDTIEVMGITEFAKMAKVEKSRVVEFTKEKRNLKPSTLDTFLKPFRLKTKLIFEKVA